MARSRWALACKDFIRLRLTGEALTDPTDASGGALMDPAVGEYGRSLFDALDMPGVLEKLPPIVGNSAIAGHVRADMAGNLGLAAGTPVAGSMMDVAACALGAGVLDDRRMVMIAGTWSINAVEMSGSLPDGPPPILNMLHRDRACRLVAEGSPSSAANLGWYLKQAMGDRVGPGDASTSVAATPVEARRCQFLPFIYGPEPRRGAFVDLGADDDEGTMLRAIFEGVAFQHRVHAEHALQHAGASWPGSIRLAGGAARSPQWAQIFADICQRPVEVAQAEDVGALGAAICAAVAGDIYPDLATAAAAMTHLGRTHEPNQQLSPFYEGRFEEFLRLDQGMMGLFERSAADRSKRPTNTTGRERP